MDFGVDRSSRFPVTARIDRQTDRLTDVTESLTHTGGRSLTGNMQIIIIIIIILITRFV